MHPKFLQQELKKSHFLIPLGASLLLFFILSVLQPLGFPKMLPLKRWVLISTFTINLFSIYTLSLLIFREIQKNRKLKLSPLKTNLILFFVIVLSSLLILQWQAPVALKKNTAQIILATLLCVGLIQTLVFFSTKLLVKTALQSDEKEFIILKDNTQHIKINTTDFIFAKSCGNYIEIYDTAHQKPHLLRSTLKTFEEMNDFDFLVRCHKSFIVNTNKISSITGNSRGYSASIMDVNEITIPVSRNKGESLKKMTFKNDTNN